MLTFVNKL